MPPGKYTSSRAGGQRRSTNNSTSASNSNPAAAATNGTTTTTQRSTASGSSRSSPASSSSSLSTSSSPYDEMPPQPPAYEGTLSFSHEGSASYQPVQAGSSRVPRSLVNVNSTNTNGNIVLLPSPASLFPAQPTAGSVYHTVRLQGPGVGVAAGTTGGMFSGMGAGMMSTAHGHRSVVQLAPLEYLQNVPPIAREPMDDRALRSFGGFS